MPYLDKEEKFYDYRTKQYDGRNPFDSSKTGISFYNQFLTDPDYMEEYKNLKASIVEMSPMEYFAECAKIFNSTPLRQKEQTGRDVEIIEHLKLVLTKYQRTFPLTFLNYAEESQEGRHRMYVVGELLGWDKKFPVMIVDGDNLLKQKEKEEAQLQNKKDEAISLIDKYLDEFSSTPYDSVEDLIDDFKYYLNRKYDNVNIYPTRDALNFEIDDQIEYKVPIWKFIIDNLESTIDDEDYDYEEMLAELERAGLKNW